MTFGNRILEDYIGGNKAGLFYRLFFSVVKLLCSRYCDSNFKTEHTFPCGGCTHGSVQSSAVLQFGKFTNRFVFSRPNISVERPRNLAMSWQERLDCQRKSKTEACEVKTRTFTKRREWKYIEN
jgi:hypothetical protein